MPLALDCLVERFPCNPWNGILSGPVNFGQHQTVSAFKGHQKVVKEVLGATVSVRLKDHGQGALPTFPDRADGRAHLHRVMAVIVDHQNIANLPFNFEAAMDAVECRKCLGSAAKRDLQLMSDS